MNTFIKSERSVEWTEHSSDQGIVFALADLRNEKTERKHVRR